MKYIFFIFILSVFLFSCNDQEDEDDPATLTNNTFTIKVYSYGQCPPSSQYLEANTDLGTNPINEQSEFRITKETDTIEVALGNAFGVEFEIKSETYKNIPLRVEWILPRNTFDTNIEDSISSQTSELIVSPNEITHSRWTFEWPFELQKGRWQYRLYYRNHLLYRRNFYMI